MDVLKRCVLSDTCRINTSKSIMIRTSYVCPSVCHALVDRKIAQFNSCFDINVHTPGPRRNPCEVASASNETGVGKTVITHFRPISRYISETIESKHMVTIKEIRHYMKECLISLVTVLD